MCVVFMAAMCVWDPVMARIGANFGHTSGASADKCFATQIFRAESAQLYIFDNGLRM